MFNANKIKNYTSPKLAYNKIEKELRKSSSAWPPIKRANEKNIHKEGMEIATIVEDTSEKDDRFGKFKRNNKIHDVYNDEKLGNDVYKENFHAETRF